MIELNENTVRAVNVWGKILTRLCLAYAAFFFSSLIPDSVIPYLLNVFGFTLLFTALLRLRKNGPTLLAANIITALMIGLQIVSVFLYFQNGGINLLCKIFLDIVIVLIPVSLHFSLKAYLPENRISASIDLLGWFMLVTEATWWAVHLGYIEIDHGTFWGIVMIIVFLAILLRIWFVQDHVTASEAVIFSRSHKRIVWGIVAAVTAVTWIWSSVSMVSCKTVGKKMPDTSGCADIRESLVGLGLPGNVAADLDYNELLLLKDAKAVYHKLEEQNELAALGLDEKGVRFTADGDTGHLDFYYADLGETYFVRGDNKYAYERYICVLCLDWQKDNAVWHDGISIRSDFSEGVLAAKTVYELDGESLYSTIYAADSEQNSVTAGFLQTANTNNPFCGYFSFPRGSKNQRAYFLTEVLAPRWDYRDYTQEITAFSYGLQIDLYHIGNPLRLGYIDYETAEFFGWDSFSVQRILFRANIDEEFLKLPTETDYYKWLEGLRKSGIINEHVITDKNPELHYFEEY